jgi:hypothetical protein
VIAARPGPCGAARAPRAAATRRPAVPRAKPPGARRALHLPHLRAPCPPRAPRARPHGPTLPGQPAAGRLPPGPGAPGAAPPTLRQVLVLQATLAELSGHPVAGPLAALGGMAPEALQRQISGSGLDLPGIMAKLAAALPPERAAAAAAAFEAAGGAGGGSAAAPPPPRGGRTASASPAPRPPEPVESIEDMARRIKPGTMKRSMFDVLVDKSDAGGLSVGEIYEELERRGQVSGWPDVKAARSAISSACSADPGMARLRQGVFALKARLPPDVLERLCGGGGGGGGSGGPSPAPAAAAPQGPITVQRAAAARRGAGGPRGPAAPGSGGGPAAAVAASAAPPPPHGFPSNEHVCAGCRAVYHPSFSPLLLCDYCPSAFHLVCADLDWPDLPAGDWACPTCMQRHGHHAGCVLGACGGAGAAKEGEPRRRPLIAWKPAVPLAQKPALPRRMCCRHTQQVCAAAAGAAGGARARAPAGAAAGSAWRWPAAQGAGAVSAA